MPAECLLAYRGAWCAGNDQLFVRPPACCARQEEASTSGKDDEGAADAGDGARSAAGAEDDGADTWRRAAREVARLHAQRHPGAPLAISGDELAEVLRSAASGAVDVLQQSLDPPHFCARPTVPRPTSAAIPAQSVLVLQSLVPTRRLQLERAACDAHLYEKQREVRR